MQQLLAMVLETGRYPSRSAPEAAERTLAAWLQRRRNDARAGRLAPEFRDGLAVLPGWQGAPRVLAEAARWQDRLAALVAYRAADRTGRGTRQPLPLKSMNWGSGCTPSGTSCVGANSIQRKRGRWTQKRQAGGSAGSVAGSPIRRQFQLDSTGHVAFAFVAIACGLWLDD